MSFPRSRFIFCVNSGRSGSQYLAALFASDPQTAAFHEAKPEMTGEILRLVERHSYPETYAARRHKAAACRALLNAQPGKSVYAETNHMFIKTFFDVAMNELAGADSPVGVVILRRELARVVKSFVELGIYTERNVYWPAWMPSVEACTRAIDPPAPEASLTPLERIIAYLIDVEARAQRFLRRYPEANVFETRLERIGSDPAEIRRLFTWAGLKVSAESLALIGKRVNDRTQRKTTIGSAIGYVECRDAVTGYLERCRQAGIPVPATLALTETPPSQNAIADNRS